MWGVWVLKGWVSNCTTSLYICHRYLPSSAPHSMCNVAGLAEKDHKSERRMQDGGTLPSVFTDTWYECWTGSQVSNGFGASLPIKLEWYKIMVQSKPWPMFREVGSFPFDPSKPQDNSCRWHMILICEVHCKMQMLGILLNSWSL